jgi:hypothetical protein
MPSTSTSDTRRELEFAKRALAEGEWTTSEIVCRNILDRRPDCGVALQLLGRIAAKVGALEQAKAYLEASLVNASPGLRLFKKLQFSYTGLSSAISGLRNRNAGDRFLVIKTWEAGFWSDISHVLGSLLLAEITDRIPVIHWGKFCLYSDGSSQDSFRNYFQPASNLSLTDLLKLTQATFFPPKWTRENLTEDGIGKLRGKWARLGTPHFLNRPENIAVVDFYIGVIYVAPWIPRHHAMHGKSVEDIYAYLVEKYLRVQPAIRDKCDAFFDQHLSGGPFIAVHMRGSDKIIEETNLHDTNATIRDAVAAMPPDYRILLLTDDEHHLAEMKSLYGERVVATECQRTVTLVGTHYLPSVDPVMAGKEIVADVYLALRADQFIGSGGSNVSAMIALMRRWPPGNCVLIGESQLARRQISVYRPRFPTSRKRSWQSVRTAILRRMAKFSLAIRERSHAVLETLRAALHPLPANTPPKVIVNVYKDAGLWQNRPPGIGDYLRGCAFLLLASSKGAFAGQFRPGVNMDLCPAAGFLQRSKFYRPAERSELQGAREFFYPPRDGNLLHTIEKFLQSNEQVLFISTNQSWKGLGIGLDVAPPRLVLDEVAQMMTFTLEFSGALLKSVPVLETEYILIHVRDADRGSPELAEDEDELAFRARAMRFAEKVNEQHAGETLVCISNNVRLRRVLCATLGMVDPETAVQNTGFVGTLSEAELTDIALIRGAKQLYVLSYFRWNSGFSVWISRLFGVPALFENARSQI